MGIQTRTALLIDDDKGALSILESELLRLGYIVSSISHPSRTNETLDRLDQIDVIFLDLEMPVHTGFEVLEMLREMDIDAPVIAHTVHYDHMNKMRKKGFDGMIAKPLQLATLEDNLNRIIQGDSVWESV